MIKLGLCSVTFRRKSMEELVELCSRVGLEGIEVGGDIHLPPGSPQAEVDKVAGLCRGAGIEIPSYGSYFNVLEHGAADFGPVLETAVRLGAGTIRIWPGWVEPEQMTQAQLGTIASTARAAAAAAAEKGVRVAFEFHLNSPTSGAKSTLRLLEAAGHDNLYTYYQFLEPGDIKRNIDDLKAVFPRLANLHCHYYEGEVCKPLADGRKLWAAICSTLKELDYRGYIFMEFVKDDSPEQLARDVALLRELVGR
ncbi:MAG: sugar phosphate isomerase/epimerase [Candidatus Glassbacteria bacterium]|nr:sugar phosphate isomerase/epimerase [Candidatus Glassbacteria bacterium]